MAENDFLKRKVATAEARAQMETSMTYYNAQLRNEVKMAQERCEAAEAVSAEIKSQHEAFLEEREMMKSLMNMDNECAAAAQELMQEQIKDLEKWKKTAETEILGLRLQLSQTTQELTDAAASRDGLQGMVTVLESLSNDLYDKHPEEVVRELEEQAIVEGAHPVHVPEKLLSSRPDRLKVQQIVGSFRTDEKHLSIEKVTAVFDSLHFLPEGSVPSDHPDIRSFVAADADDMVSLLFNGASDSQIVKAHAVLFPAAPERQFTSKLERMEFRAKKTALSQLGKMLQAWNSVLESIFSKWTKSSRDAKSKAAAAVPDAPLNRQQLEQYMKHMVLPSFESLDKNNDGVIDRAEFEKLIAMMQQQQQQQLQQGVAQPAVETPSPPVEPPVVAAEPAQEDKKEYTSLFSRRVDIDDSDNAPEQAQAQGQVTSTAEQAAPADGPRRTVSGADESAASATTPTDVGVVNEALTAEMLNEETILAFEAAPVAQGLPFAAACAAVPASATLPAAPEEVMAQDHVDFKGLKAKLEAVKEHDPSLLASAEEEEQALDDEAPPSKEPEAAVDDTVRLFDKIDFDGNGFVTVDELRTGIRSKIVFAGLGLDEAARGSLPPLDAFFEKHDEDGGGSLDQTEFAVLCQKIKDRAAAWVAKQKEKAVVVDTPPEEEAEPVLWGDKVCFESIAQSGKYWRSDRRQDEPPGMTGPTRDGTITWQLGRGNGAFNYGDQCWLRSDVTDECFHADVKENGPMRMGPEDGVLEDKMVSLMAPDASMGPIRWGDVVQIKLGAGGIAPLYLLSDTQDGGGLSIGSNHAEKIETHVVDRMAWHIRHPGGV